MFQKFLFTTVLTTTLVHWLSSHIEAQETSSKVVNRTVVSGVLLAKGTIRPVANVKVLLTLAGTIDGKRRFGRASILPTQTDSVGHFQFKSVLPDTYGLQVRGLEVETADGK